MNARRIELPGRGRPEILDGFLDKIRASRPDEICVPSDIDVGSYSGDSAHVAQVLASWASLTDGKRSLHVALNPLNVETLRQYPFSATLAGMAALYLADQVTNSSQSLSRFVALGAIVDRVKAMQSAALEDTTVGKDLLLCCFAEARGEYLPALYDFPRSGGVRDESGFRTLVRQALRRLGRNLTASVAEPQLEALASITHQLFLNCDQHGAYEIGAEKIRRGLRGVSLRAVEIADPRRFAADHMLSNYIAQMQVTPYPGRDFPAGGMTLIELSVFDTGPGMALHWLAKKQGKRNYEEFSTAEELDAIQTCFREHSTTKPDSLSGMGLAMVVDNLRKLDAFVAIRAGRLALFQNFAADREFELKPRNRYPDRPILPEIVGTNFSVVFRAHG